MTNVYTKCTIMPQGLSWLIDFIARLVWGLLQIEGGKYYSVLSMIGHVTHTQIYIYIYIYIYKEIVIYSTCFI